MKRKIWFVIILIIILSIQPAFAANWVLVGTLTLSSGESRTDYVDLDSIAKDKAGGGITFWVMSETKDSALTLRKMAKYITQSDQVRCLEWHVYDLENRELMNYLKPEPDWEYPEEFSLLYRAVEIAWEHAQSQ
ncbi:MAG: hypothetical protein K6U80_10910 [Firmicutes bacterium]|nr:hypothetical protein [Bacillota bacterium]